MTRFECEQFSVEIILLFESTFPKNINKRPQPSSEPFTVNGDVSPKSNFYPPQPFPQSEQKWDVNDLEDYFPPCYYHLPLSKHHVIKNCSSLTYSKDGNGVSFASIVSKTPPISKKTQKTERIVEHPKLKSDTSPIKVIPPKPEEMKMKDSFYFYDQKKGYQIDLDVNMKILEKKFGKYFPSEILKISFQNHQYDLQNTIRDCALDVAWNLTFPFRQDEDGKKVCFEIFC